MKSRMDFPAKKAKKRRWLKLVEKMFLYRLHMCTLARLHIVPIQRSRLSHSAVSFSLRTLTSLLAMRPK